MTALPFLARSADALPSASGPYPAFAGRPAAAEHLRGVERPAAGAAASRVMPALAEAARQTGVPFEALYHTARLESGFDPDARARTSSATGLFQFIDSTWLQTLAKHGARHGLSPASRAEALAMRRDPYAASLMAANHMADNAAVLADRTGRTPGPVELYLAHFLGAGGAVAFLDRLAEAPDAPAAPLLPAAARANRSIFFSDGRPRSLAEVHDLFARKLSGGAAPAPSLPRVRYADSSGPDGPEAMSGPGGSPLTPSPGDGRAPDRALASARLAYLLLADMGG